MAYEDYFTGSQFDYASKESDIAKTQSGLISKIEAADPTATMYGYGQDKPTMSEMWSKGAMMGDLTAHFGSTDYGVFGADRGTPTSGKDLYGSIESYEKERGGSKHTAADYMYGLFKSMGFSEADIDSYLGQGGQSRSFERMFVKDWDNLDDEDRYVFNNLFRDIYGGGADDKGDWTITDPELAAQRSAQTIMFNNPTLDLDQPYKGVITIDDESLAGRAGQVSGVGQTYEGKLGEVKEMGQTFGAATRGKTLGFGTTGLAGSGAFSSDLQRGRELYGEGIEGARGARSQSWADIGSKMMGFAQEDQEAVQEHYDATTGAYDEWLTTLTE